MRRATNKMWRHSIDKEYGPMRKPVFALALRAKKRKGFEIKLSVNGQQFPETLDDIIEPMQGMVDMLREFKKRSIEEVSAQSGERVPASDIGIKGPSGPMIMLGRRLN
jgi:hypothetical protein